MPAQALHGASITLLLVIRGRTRIQREKIARVEMRRRRMIGRLMGLVISAAAVLEVVDGEVKRRKSLTLKR